MSSPESPTKEEQNEEYTNDSEELNGHSYKLLKTEYDKCRQKVHELQRKLELNEIMLREFQEANESLERSVELQTLAKDKIIVETTEKYRVLSKEYENTISTLEEKLAEQATEIEELYKRANNSLKCESISPTKKSLYLALESENVTLKNRISRLLSIQREEVQKLERAEARIDELKAQCDEFEYHSRGMKEQLNDKDQALETLRAELALNRVETASLETEEPQRESHKGNSLFAEVEDRRRKIVNKMSALREKYVEMKGVCKLQSAEIKALRAERVAQLRKWGNDADHTLTENGEFIQKYKSRITELEWKLKSEIMKNVDLEQRPHTDTSFGYLISLLDAKRKETAELRIQVEDLRTKQLIHDEAKSNIEKQLKYWQYKAYILEAQVCAAQTELKLNIADDVEYDLRSEPDKLVGTRNTKVTVKEKGSLSPYSDRPIIQDTDQNLQGCRDRDPSANNEVFESRYAVESNKVFTSEKSCEAEFGQIEEGNDVKRANKVLRFDENNVTHMSKTSQKTTDNCKYPVIYIPTDSSN